MHRAELGFRRVSSRASSDTPHILFRDGRVRGSEPGVPTRRAVPLLMPLMEPAELALSLRWLMVQALGPWVVLDVTVQARALVLVDVWRV